jgi:hypothetical protein
LNRGGGALFLPRLELGDGIGDVSLREVKPSLRPFPEIPPFCQRRDLDSEMASDLSSGQIGFSTHDSDSFSDW